MKKIIVFFIGLLLSGLPSHPAYALEYPDIGITLLAYGLAQPTYGWDQQGYTREQLVDDQKQFFTKIADNEEIDLDVGTINTIDPSISQLTKLKKLAVSSSSPHSSSILDIPIELISLPSLENLILYGFEYKLITDKSPEVVQSKIKSLSIINGLEHSVKFLNYLPSLEELSLVHGNFKQLPEHIQTLHNLKYLTISNNTTRSRFIFDDILCQLQSLETLNLEATAMPRFPSCIKQMNNLKKLDILTCGDKEKLPNGENIFFPVALIKFPAIEHLTVRTNGPMSLPKDPGGLRSLKSISFPVYYESGMAGCDQGFDGNPREALANGDSFNLDNIIQYPNLEEIYIENSMYLISGNDAGKASADDEDIYRYTIEKFSKRIDSAVHQGKLKKLKFIKAWDGLGPDYDMTIIWQRPAKAGKSGIKALPPIPKE